MGILWICLSLFSIMGGHWAVLQSIAWVQMIHNYSQDSTLRQAVVKTFNGENACDLCMRVKEGREQEQKAPAAVKVDKKSEVLALSIYKVLPTPPLNDFSYPDLLDLFPAIYKTAPVLPPPKALHS